MKCIDKTGHEWVFIGYMVVANELEEKRVDTKKGNTIICPVPVVKVPVYSPAKIEIWQCDKCGWVSLKPAVLTRLTDWRIIK